jgi:hypothetical protein
MANFIYMCICMTLDMAIGVCSTQCTSLNPAIPSRLKRFNLNNTIHTKLYNDIQSEHSIAEALTARRVTDRINKLVIRFRTIKLYRSD